MISKDILNRKGPPRLSAVRKDVSVLLNKGKIESVNLMEFLSVDQVQLLKNTLPSLGCKSQIVSICKKIHAMEKVSQMQRLRLIGNELMISLLNSNRGENILKKMEGHPSDMVRSWATFVIGGARKPFGKKLKRMKKLANDSNSGVREIAWLALREDIINNVREAIGEFKSWVKDENPNIRRFASEATRPRGVWCPKIPDLIEDPSLALVLLNPLKSDSSKYVRDSVGNWLNDASKSDPKWVSGVCQKWDRLSKSKETAYIIGRALRTLKK